MKFRTNLALNKKNKENIPAIMEVPITTEGRLTTFAVLMTMSDVIREYNGIVTSRTVLFRFKEYFIIVRHIYDICSTYTFCL
jgi:hypothetical protein